MPPGARLNGCAPREVSYDVSAALRREGRREACQLS